MLGDYDLGPKLLLIIMIRISVIIIIVIVITLIIIITTIIIIIVIYDLGPKRLCPPDVTRIARPKLRKEKRKQKTQFPRKALR